VEQNNAELERLRQEMAAGETSMFSLKTQQHTLESELDSLRARKELQIGLNEERRLSQLKIGV